VPNVIQKTLAKSVWVKKMELRFMRGMPNLIPNSGKCVWVGDRVAIQKDDAQFDPKLWQICFNEDGVAIHKKDAQLDPKLWLMCLG
jgi:hypothetical protein